jgi:hypothetical protein
MRTRNWLDKTWGGAQKWALNDSSVGTGTTTQLYDEIGIGYGNYRRPEPRIAAAILYALATELCCASPRSISVTVW